MSRMKSNHHNLTNIFPKKKSNFNSTSHLLQNYKVKGCLNPANAALATSLAIKFKTVNRD